MSDLVTFAADSEENLQW